MPKPAAVPYRLETERLIIRCYQLEDAQAVLEAVQESRPHVERWLPWARAGMQDMQGVLDFVKRSRGRYDLMEDFTMGVFTHDGDYLGGTGLHRFDWDLGRFEIGYWLRQSATGKGYVTEAARRLTVYCFEDLGAERVEIRADVDNLPSRAVAERLGYPLEGILRRIAKLYGEHRDHALYAMVREEYEAGRLAN